jgi:Arc/MetJ family transcription regulator
MKTTIDIPDVALADAMRFTKARTKREAVVTALEDFNRRRRMAEAARILGTSDTFLSKDALMKSRCVRRTP